MQEKERMDKTDFGAVTITTLILIIYFWTAIETKNTLQLFLGLAVFLTVIVVAISYTVFWNVQFRKREAKRNKLPILDNQEENTKIWNQIEKEDEPFLQESQKISNRK